MVNFNSLKNRKYSIFLGILIILNIYIIEGCTTFPFQQISGSPLSAGTSPFSVAFSPQIGNNYYMAVANFNSGNVTIYSATSSTGFTSSNSFTLPAGTNPISVAFSPQIGSNYYMAIANFSSNTVTIYSATSSTGFTPSSIGFSLATGTNPNSVAFSPEIGSNFYMAIANNGGNVTVYSATSSTGFTSGSPSFTLSAGTTPQSVAFSSQIGDNFYMAIANGFNSSNATIYSATSSTGFTSSSPSFTLSTGSQPYSVAFSSQIGSNYYMAIANFSSNTVTIYSATSSTGFTSGSTSFTLPTGSIPRSVSFSPEIDNNYYMAISNQGDNTVTIYSATSSAGFTASSTSSTLSAGSGPFSVSFSPPIGNNYYMAISSEGDNNVIVYSINAPCLFLTGNSSICQGQTTDLFSYVIGGQYPYTYTWTGPNNSSGSGQIIPANLSGTYYATVVDDNGSTGTANLTLTVNSLPNFTLSPTSPINLCSGTTKAVTVSGATGSYQWINPSGTVISTGNSITAGTAGANISGIYNVKVTNANNCSSSQCFAININSLPTANLTTDAANNNYCSGSNINIFAEPTSGAEPITYSWSGPKGTFTTTGPLLTISDADTTDSGAYTANFIDNNGCTGTANINVIVNNLPSFTLSPASPINLCSGTTKTVTVSGATGSYQWINPSGAVISTTNSMTAGGAGATTSGVYSVEVTNANNCSSSQCFAININSLPTANLTTDATNNNYCSGSKINIFAEPTSGAEPITYSWSGPKGTFATTGPLLTIPDADTTDSGNYTANFTDNNGCTGTANINVIVNNLPSFTVTSQRISPTEIQLFTNIGSGSYSFAWTGPNFTSTEQNPVISNTSSADSGVYTVTVTDLNTGCSAQGSIAVDIEKPADVVIEPTTLTVCQGSSISLTADEISGVAPFTFNWAGPNGYTNNSPTVFINNSTVENSGTYVLTLTDSNNSIATSSATVTVNALPEVNLITAGNTNVTSGSTVTLIAIPTTGKAPFTLNWYKNGLLIHTDYNVTGPTKLNVVVTNSAEYNVVIIDSNNCQSDPLNPASIIFINIGCKQNNQNGSCIHLAIADKYCNG